MNKRGRELFLIVGWIQFRWTEYNNNFAMHQWETQNQHVVQWRMQFISECTPQDFAVMSVWAETSIAKNTISISSWKM